MGRTILPYLFLILGFTSAGQKPYPKGYFRAPLDIPLYLSGNFGEIRTNHFHTGLDIKTEGREGLPVYAVADGYISRIRVSAVGYGLALYITHPNGYTTTYGHLQSFNRKITDYTETRQYSQRSFEVDLALKPNEIVVKQGEVIALSGNSGGSGGPHLHFEIRDSKTEKAINPLFFGFKIDDSVKPHIAGIRVFALNDYSNVNGSSYAIFPATGKGGKYALKPGTSISVNGEIGFALHATDMLDGNANSCGVYSIEMFLDDSLVHRQEMEKLDFNLNRYLNAHVDYRQFRRTKSSIHKCFLEPNNKLEIYPYSPSRGRLHFQDEKKHLLKFVVRDVYGNTSVIETQVQSSSKKLFTAKQAGATQRYVSWDKRFNPVTPAYEIDLPAGNLYKNEILTLSEQAAPAGYYSNILTFGDDEIPVHGNYKVKMTAPRLTEELRPFAYLAQLNDNLKVARFAGKKWEGLFLTGESRTFGKFAVAIDSVSPYIKPINITEGKDFNPGQTIVFTGSDAHSGIASYALYIDNNWVLLAYDAKYARFTCKLDDKRITRGSHRLQFVLTDNVGNSRTFECNFTMH